MAEEKELEFDSLSKEQLSSYFDLLLKNVRFSQGIPPKVTISGDGTEVARGLKHLVSIEGDSFSLYADGSTYNALANVAYHLDLYPETLHLADRAIARDSASTPARLIKAHALIALNNPKKAIGVLDEVLKREPKNIIAHTLTARSLVKREQYTRALEAFKQVYLLKPSLETLMESLVCQIHLKDEPRASNLIEEARVKFSADLQLTVLSSDLATEAYGLRKIDLLKFLVRIFPENGEAWRNLARLYRENNEYERAWRCYMRSIRESKPDEETVKEIGKYASIVKEEFECKACKGTRKCKVCKNGLCTECRNGICPVCKGKKVCKLCNGSERCPECGGRGTKGLLKRCKACSGKGICECYNGKCQECKGSGKCPSCKGLAKCPSCKGSTRCSTCEGRGITIKIELSDSTI